MSPNFFLIFETVYKIKEIFLKMLILLVFFVF
jgi:hypothetical protein